MEIIFNKINDTMELNVINRKPISSNLGILTPSNQRYNPIDRCIKTIELDIIKHEYNIIYDLITKESHMYIYNNKIKEEYTECFQNGQLNLTF